MDRVGGGGRGVVPRLRRRPARGRQPVRTAALRTGGRPTLRALEGECEQHEPGVPAAGRRSAPRPAAGGGLEVRRRPGRSAGGGGALSECYPYTTLVGAPELGYPLSRPTYKRRPASVPTARWRAVRAEVCDELIARLAGLVTADPPLRLDSHPVARRLLDEPTPEAAGAYKHREDLIDALLCAWTASLWARHGLTRCQVLGPGSPTARSLRVTWPRSSRPPGRSSDGTAPRGESGAGGGTGRLDKVRATVQECWFLDTVCIILTRVRAMPVLRDCS